MASDLNTEKVGRANLDGLQTVLLSWGANSYGQLGQGHQEDQLVPSVVSHAPNFSTITGGGGHTLALTVDGQLWCCGSNNKGHLGLDNTEDVHTFTRVTALNAHKVTAVAGGWDFTLAVTGSGQLFSWGSNSFGQLGQPDLPKGSSVPVCVALDEPVKMVAAGLRHGVALTAQGSVYCWGHAKHGQCGPTQDEKPALKVVSPRRVAIPGMAGTITSVVAGSYHTAALTAEGQVLVWGCNKYGQCGLDPVQASTVCEPRLLDNLPPNKVTSLHSGWTHMLAHTNSGALYSWGRGDYGQLGQDPVPCRHVPALVQTTFNIQHCACGSEHNLLVTDGGHLCSVGWNEHGLCGTGDEENVHAVTFVPSLASSRVLLLGCGGGHCYVTVQQDPDHG